MSTHFIINYQNKKIIIDIITKFVKEREVFLWGRLNS
jgi:hypothetical protein